jgi:hypothetical protein
MTDPDQVAIPGDDGNALMSGALVDALDGRQPVAANLRGAVVEYVLARKKRGAPPEEVIVELKSLISSLLAAGADERVASWHLANDVSELVVRLAIESYFSD